MIGPPLGIAVKPRSSFSPPSRRPSVTFIEDARNRSTIEQVFVTVDLPSRSFQGFLPMVFIMAFGVSLYGSDTKAFSRFGVEQGISQVSITCITQDSTGFLWFGTRDGLNRFDGYQFKIYNKHNTAGMPDSGISDLLEFPKGRLLAATTGGGLVSLDLVADRVTVLRVNFGATTGLSANHLTKLLPADDHHVWIAGINGLDLLDTRTNQITRTTLPFTNSQITALASGPDQSLILGTSREGLWQYRPKTESFSRITPKSRPAKTGISSLLRDQQGRLWIGTARQGLFRCDEDGTDWVRVQPNPTMPANILCILQESETVFWIGSEQYGVFCYDLAADAWRAKNHRPGQISNTGGSMVMSLFLDHTGLLWIGTGGDGVVRYNRANERFNHLLAGTLVRGFSEDPDGTFWVATHGQGLFHLSRDGSIKQQFRNNNHRSGFRGRTAITVTHTKDGTLWVGTKGQGLLMRPPNESQFSSYRHDPNRPTSLSGDQVWTVMEDNRGRLWVGTEFNGLNVMDRSEPGRFQHFKAGENRHPLSDNEVRVVSQDSSGRIWVGTENGGLNRLNEAETGFTWFLHDPADPTSMASNNIKTITEDTAGRLWIGTTYGLCRYFSDEAGFRTYTQRDGLPNNVVYAVLEDDAQNLWLSTNKGLAKFQPDTGDIETYSGKDGLQGMEFNTGAYGKTGDGRLVFGGVNGFNLFTPSDIVEDPIPPSVVITDLLIFNQSQTHGAADREQPSSHQGALFATDQLLLKPDDDMVTLEFAALHFANPLANRYRYKLDGLDDQWVTTDGSNRRATYTFLPPGRFRFMVQAANHDGVWNDTPTVLSLRVLPAWWQTKWAYLAYVLLISAAVGRYIQRQIHIRTMLEDTVASRTESLHRRNDQLRAVDRMVHAVNSVRDISEFTHIMVEVLPFRDRIQRARLLSRQPNDTIYTFQGVLGWDQEKLAPIKLTMADIIKDYSVKLKRIDTNFYHWRRDFNNHHKETLFGEELPATILVLRVRVDEDSWAYLSFENMDDDEAFEGLDFSFMPLFQEHLFTAFSRLHLMEKLQLVNQRKNEFLGIAAHDLRAPINGMILTAQYMRELLLEEETDKMMLISLLDRCEKAAADMERLLSELLNISAIESGTVRLELGSVPMHASIEEVLTRYRQAAAKKSIELRLAPPAASDQVYADPLRIREILDNLISNALKYTHPGGTVTIRSEFRDGMLITHVRDTGQGMNSQDLDNAFRAFTRLSAKPTGGESSTGLGLAIVKKLVVVQGGEVWVESEQGQGSQFSFSLPIDTQKSRKAQETTALI